MPRATQKIGKFLKNKLKQKAPSGKQSIHQIKPLVITRTLSKNGSNALLWQLAG